MAVLNATTNILHPFLRKGFRTKRVVNLAGDPADEIVLAGADIRQLAGDHRWRVIGCLEGELWITQNRDVRDYLLTAGEMFIITQPGTVVIQARQPSRLQITPSLASSPCAGDFGKTIFR